jgi:hypothetical protein
VSNPFAKAIKKHSGNDPSDAAQIALGTPRADGLSDEHTGFLKNLFTLIDKGKIDTKNPMSFVHEDVYGALPDDLRAKTDQAIPNICTLLERIMDLHARPEKNDSFEMKNLIETLWQAKQRIEDRADVFIF